MCFDFADSLGVHRSRSTSTSPVLSSIEVLYSIFAKRRVHKVGASRVASTGITHECWRANVRHMVSEKQAYGKGLGQASSSVPYKLFIWAYGKGLGLASSSVPYKWFIWLRYGLSRIVCKFLVCYSFASSGILRHCHYVNSSGLLVE